MQNKPNHSGTLILEETLFILQECLQVDRSCFPASTIENHHIQKLKTFYSPRFDFDHSESGSYFFATLQSIHVCFIDKNADYKISLSRNFKISLECLLDISMLSMNYRKNKHIVIEQLISLSGIWGLNTTLDIQSLIIQILEEMRADLVGKTQI